MHLYTLQWNFPKVIIIKCDTQHSAFVNHYTNYLFNTLSSSDDIQPSTLLSNQSPSGLILKRVLKSQALGNTLYEVYIAECINRQHVL